MSPAFNRLFGVVEYFAFEKIAQEQESDPFQLSPVFYRLFGVFEYIKIEKTSQETESEPLSVDNFQLEYPAAVYQKLSPRTTSPREESAFERYLRLKKQALLDRNHSVLQMIDPIKP